MIRTLKSVQQEQGMGYILMWVTLFAVAALFLICAGHDYFYGPTP
jgi:hypothetical protein